MMSVCLEASAYEIVISSVVLWYNNYHLSVEPNAFMII